MNFRQHYTANFRNACVLLFFWLPIFLFSLLIIRNTIPYFSFSNHFTFIRERAVLFLQPFYKVSFYLHIFAGMFCIGTALLQFSSFILKQRKAIHISSGRIYVFVVLVIGAPTGLYMSFFAKGSMAERLLFMFMALSWFFFTAKGLSSVLQRQIAAHKFWMIRSYAMALTAVTFRVYYIILYVLGFHLTMNYEISLWLSVLGNMLFAEIIVQQNAKHYKSTFTN